MDDSQIKYLRSELSETFCLAKFHHATISLFQNQIAGCYHNPFSPLGDTVDTFFNTPLRKQEQDEMLNGGQPSGCSYCWNSEAYGLKSDRYQQTKFLKTHEPIHFYKNRDSIFKPKYLEISFQKTCNLACSYCNPDFSTAWANDIRVNGKYENLLTDSRNHYARDDYTTKQTDLKLFWRWYDTVVEGLETIRITGGEPLLHKELFETLDYTYERNPGIKVAVNSNLINSEPVIERFTQGISRFGNSVCFTSNESAGALSEFIRDGLIYDEWKENVRRVARAVQAVWCTATMSVYALIGLDELALDIIAMRKEGLNVRFFPTILTHPEFHSFDSLAQHERDFYIVKYTKFLDDHSHDLLSVEKENLTRVIGELRKPVSPNQEFLRQDLQNFTEQYIMRRKKPINFYNMIGEQ